MIQPSVQEILLIKEYYNMTGRQSLLTKPILKGRRFLPFSNINLYAEISNDQSFNSEDIATQIIWKLYWLRAFGVKVQQKEFC